MKKILIQYSLVMSMAVSVGAVAQGIEKKELSVKTETLERGRARIQRSIETRSFVFEWNQTSDLYQTKRAVVDRKTVELIKQIEGLLKRPGQTSREGELKMRLAELYYEFAQSSAVMEGESWEQAVKIWENLPPEKRKTTSRPQLKTPKTDTLRKKTVTLYQDLEKRSRNLSEASRQGIRREDVLFFLATTLLDLGNRPLAMPYFKELVENFPKSPRALSTHLNLADLQFERKQYEDAIQNYLKVASEKKFPSGAESIRTYAVYRLAWCYQNVREFDKAVIAFKKALQLLAENLPGPKTVFESEVLMDLAIAFVYAENFQEGESFFRSKGEVALPALVSFLRQSSISKEDRGLFEEATEYLDKLIAINPMSLEAKDYSLEKLNLFLKAKNSAMYQKQLKVVAETYGVGSNWWRARNVQDQKIITEELVSLLRREAKNRHKAAQVKNDTGLYQDALQFYTIYFEYVPEPNPDTFENLSEMRFYLGELKYRLGMYLEAEKDYALVSDNKLKSQALFNRIVSLQKVDKKVRGSDFAKRFQNAVDDFSKQNPTDPRTAQLVYASANESFENGDSASALSKLDQLVTQFSKQKIGLDAAERILFILEKTGDLSRVSESARQFAANKDLVNQGGAKFQNKLQNVAQLAEFKTIEAIPEEQDSDFARKARGFLEYSLKVKDDLREKALQNAKVFAEKSGDKVLLSEVQNRFIKEFPRSQFVADIYLKRAAEWVTLGEWQNARELYSRYYQNFGQKTDSQTESALWNAIFLGYHLADLTNIKIEGGKWASDELLKLCKEYLAKFPRGKNRIDVLEISLFFKNRANAEDLKLARALPSLSKPERILIEEADWVIRERNQTLRGSEVGNLNPKDLPGPLSKEIVARMQFKNLQLEFDNYQKLKIDFAPAKFVSTIKSKLDRLESLEKKYLSVVQFGRASSAFPSLERLSRAYTLLAEEIEKAPVDKEELKSFTQPLFEKGRSYVQKCLEKGLELKVGGAALESCRTRARLLAIEDSFLENERIPAPQFVPDPQGIQFTNLVLNKGLKAAYEKKWGEMKLAIRVLAPIVETFSKDEKAFYSLLSGVESYQMEQFESAAKNFRLALDASAQTGIPQLARKNLTSLYLLVGDTSAAFETISQSDPQDPVGALLFGVASKGEGELEAAVKAYEYGLSLSPNDRSLIYNLALAMASAEMWIGAVQNLQKFIELTSPGPNDESRTRLKQWRQKSQTRKNLPESTL
jgi:tetratricopeptide (TPR) repeat protein